MASEMEAPSFPVSLRPEASSNDSSNALPELIRRINAERGHLRNITEEGLKEEIHKAENGVVDQEAADDEDGNPLDLESRRKQLFDSKMEMIEAISKAHNDSLLALDFVSFLMKNDNPRAAEMTMSPALKQMFPVGALAFDRIQPPKPDASTIEHDKLVTLGWNLQGLNKSADALLQSAQRLEKEVDRETKYWDDVLSVSSKGWSVCRIRGARNTIGVRFGFSEASPAFYAQGQAVLRSNDDGHVVLDQGVMSKQAQGLRVRIHHGDQVTGESQLPTSLQGHGDDIESRIHRARDSLFEEELFHELTREYRTLMSYGVKFSDQSIRFPYSLQPPSTPLQPDHYVTISLEPQRHKAPTTGPDDAEAEAMACALRILQTHAYRQRFRKRSQPPPPLTDDKPTTPLPTLLRPLLTYLAHKSAVSAIQTSLTTLQKALASADLPATIQPPHPTLTPAHHPHTTPMESLVSSLTQPSHTTTSINLAGASLTISTATSLGDPIFGTRYTVDTHRFINVADLYAHIEACVRAALAHRVVAADAAWRVVDEQGGRLVRAGDGRRRFLAVAVRRDRVALVGGAEGEAPRPLAVWTAGAGRGGGFDDAVRRAAGEITEQLET